MGIRRLLLPLLLALGGLFALVVLQWKLDLGSFADNPQLVEVPLGARTIVGGGRGALDFVSRDDKRATLRLWCSAEESTLDLAPGDGSTDEICGVHLRLLGVLRGSPGEPPFKAAVEVSW